MNPVLEKIDPEKRDRIINAALEEFSRSGYELASTNRIVAKAGISKGLLFHYFTHKENLYAVMNEFSIELVVSTLKDNINWEETDFLKRVSQILQLKASLMEKYPFLYDFIRVSMQDVPMDKIMQSLPDDCQRMMDKIYTSNIDFSLFKPGINIEQALNIIHWSLTGMSEELWKNRKESVDFDTVFESYRQYIDTLRTLFYK